MYSDMSKRMRCRCDAEEELGEPARHLGLADARGAEEDERAHRPVRVGDAEARAADGAARWRVIGLVLADDAPHQDLFHVDQLRRFVGSRSTSTGMSVQELMISSTSLLRHFHQLVADVSRSCLKRSISSLQLDLALAQEDGLLEVLVGDRLLHLLDDRADLRLQPAQVLRVGARGAASPSRRPRRGCRSPCRGRSGR